jgi:hypothetical protein
MEKEFSSFMRKDWLCEFNLWACIFTILKDLFFRVKCTDKNFLHIFQTGSGVHPSSYPKGTGGSFLVGKAAEA